MPTDVASAPPELTPEPTGTPGLDVIGDPLDAYGAFATNPHSWSGGEGGSLPAPSPGPGSPAPTTSPGSPGGAETLQVVEPLPAVDLLDAVVGGVAGTFFGS
jgi:hypothetical protein